MAFKPLFLSVVTISALMGCMETTDTVGVVAPEGATTRVVLASNTKIGPDFLSVGEGATSGITLNADNIPNPYRTDLLGREDNTGSSSSVFSSSDGRYLTALAEGNINDVAGTLAIVTADLVGTDSGAIHIRFGESTLPTSGTASYSGEYAGFALRDFQDPAQSADLLTTGNVSLVTSFANDTVTGKITNRQAYTTDGVSLANWTAADIGIDLTTFNTDGEYQATLSGGALRAKGDTTDTFSGQVNGIIGGKNADSTSGSLFLVHSIKGPLGNVVLTERGAFNASR